MKRFVLLITLLLLSSCDKKQEQSVYYKLNEKRVLVLTEKDRADLNRTMVEWAIYHEACITMVMQGRHLTRAQAETFLKEQVDLFVMENKEAAEKFAYK